MLKINHSANYRIGVMDIVFSKAQRDILRRTADSQEQALADIRDEYLNRREKLLEEMDRIIQL